jgi:tetratricopeptide (TPR) repeat protein
MSDLQARLQVAVGDKYHVEQELGGGGMSRVFLAEEMRLGRKVVIKVLPPEMAAGVSVERFEREIQLAAKLQHPHVVPLLTAGSRDDLLYYIMPFIEGESLRAKLAREGELPVAEAVRILKDVLDALAHAHEHGVVHRDIKPDNVLLSGDHALVTDFGVAKAVSASTGEGSLTSVGVALGTPAYMAPEQATADPHVDGRADIYAVGVLAYEMLSGRPPFTGTSAQAVLSAHLTQPPEPVTTYRETVPASLNELILRCLAKKAADRWQRARDLMPQLDALLTPTGGVTPTGTQPVARVDYEAIARQVHPLRVAILFGLASAAVLALVFFIMLQLGLPDWVFVSAIILLAVGLPIMLLTGHHQRQRALVRATGVMVTTPQDGLQRWFTWRKSLLGGGMAFAGLGVVAAAYMVMRALGIGPAATLITKGILEERDPILLADFANRSSDTTLGVTVTEALRIDLSQSRAVRLVEPDLVVQTLRQMEQAPDTKLGEQLAREVAERLGVRAVVVGEIAPVGGGYVLSARLVAAADGATLLADREQAADDGELLAAIDRLSRTLREGVGESLKHVRASPPLDQVTTRSLQALRLYTMGNRVHWTGDFPGARRLIEQALALDSMFAMAWRKLSVVMTGNPLLQQAAASRAYELRNRAPLRERYLIEAVYYTQVLGDRDSTRSAYEQLLALYPDDFTALNNLASNVEPERAMQLRRRAFELYPSPFSLHTLTVTLIRNGRLDEAEGTARRLAADYPDAAPYMRLLTPAQISFLRGDFEQALDRYRSHDSAWAAAEERSTASGRAQSLMYIHWVLALQGRLSEAATYFDQAQRFAAEGSNEMHVQLAAWEGMLDVLVRDDAAQARQRIEAALLRFPLDSLPAPNRPYWSLSRLQALLGDLERAKAFANRWIDDPELPATVRTARQRDPNRNWGYRWAIGAVALHEGRLDDAVQELARASEMNGDCITTLRDLGEALERSGRPDSAITVYQRSLASLAIPAGGFGVCRLGPDALGRAAILRRLGELYEARNDRDKAIEYYNRFIELWKNADPELQPQVEDVRARIARLVGER